MGECAALNATCLPSPLAHYGAGVAWLCPTEPFTFPARGPRPMYLMSHFRFPVIVGVRSAAWMQLGRSMRLCSSRRHMLDAHFTSLRACVCMCALLHVRKCGSVHLSAGLCQFADNTVHRCVGVQGCMRVGGWQSGGDEHACMLFVGAHMQQTQEHTS